MRTEITAHMEQNYTWKTVAREGDFPLPDGHKKIGMWLDQLHLTDDYIGKIFVQHGMEDTTFVVDLTEDDLRDIGMYVWAVGLVACHVRSPARLSTVNKRKAVCMF